MTRWCEWILGALDCWCDLICWRVNPKSSSHFGIRPARQVLPTPSITFTHTRTCSFPFDFRPLQGVIKKRAPLHSQEALDHRMLSRRVQSHELVLRSEGEEARDSDPRIVGKKVRRISDRWSNVVFGTDEDLKKMPSDCKQRPECARKMIEDRWSPHQFLDQIPSKLGLYSFHGTLGQIWWGCTWRGQTCDLSIECRPLLTIIERHNSLISKGRWVSVH